MKSNNFIQRTYKKSQFIKKCVKTSENTSEKSSTSATYLVIVESPSKCKKIEEYLGSLYRCIASNGHIRTIDGLQSIDIKSSFQPMFSIIEEKREHIEYMRTMISQFIKPSKSIILATDDDREGEAIAWHICQVFDLPIDTTQRILFHEITKEAILDAIKNPTKINMNIIKAQQSRQVLDIIVGYKISPFLWKYLYHNKANSLSAGRCQTPALRLVYDNEKNRGVEEQLYKTTGVFFSKNVHFDLSIEFEKKEEVLDFLEKSKNYPHQLRIDSPKETKQSPPKPLNTSRLLQVASNILHLSPKHTMDICQQLYQLGHITYMRTESQKYSGEFIKKAENFILNLYTKREYIGKTGELENTDVCNPHEAIRVTNLELDNITNSDSRVCSLYKLIWRTSIESCMSDARYNSIKIKIDAPDNHHYQHIIEIPLFLGWKRLLEKQEKKEQIDPSSLLFYFQSIHSKEKEKEKEKENKVKYNYIDCITVFRGKCHHYTEASLINKLEGLGIGRPSTFASIIETIQDRGYVKRMDIEGETRKCTDFRLEEQAIESIEKNKQLSVEKNKLVLQPVGLLTIEFLLKYFQKLFEYEYTKNMEDELDAISAGTSSNVQLLTQCYNDILELSKPMKTLEKQIYKLDETHDFIFEKYGPVIRIRLEDGKYEYKPIKKDMKIDLEKLKLGEYRPDDLYEIKNNHLGKYEDQDLFIKNGKFGVYVEWGTKRESIRNIKKDIQNITLEDVITYLNTKDDKKDTNILRVLSNEFSVRKGKFGAYVYYKNANMDKPQFFNLNRFSEGFSTCHPDTLVDWIKTTYKIK